MSEPIPLGSALSVQVVQIIIDNIFNQRLDSVGELLTLESRRFGDIQRQTESRRYSYQHT